MANWIFLRGLTRETAHWGSFIGAFEHAVAGARVISLDLPGNGQLNTVPSPASISAMVSHCRAELARRGEKPPFHLLAMSLGAMVATEWSYQAPGEISACVLINTSMRPFSPFYRRLRPRNYFALLRLALRGASDTSWEQMVLQITSNNAARRSLVVPDWVAVRRQRPVSAWNQLRQLLAAARYRARRESPATRMLLLASERDRLVNVKCTLAIAASWRCSLELHPWAGHDIPLDDPSWVIQQVLEWQSRADSATVLATDHHGS
jgi:pimeloyl-ACP methyl ester carboxylesterase